MTQTPPTQEEIIKHLRSALWEIKMVARAQPQGGSGMDEEAYACIVSMANRALELTDGVVVPVDFQMA